MNYRLSLIQNPNQTWSFVGSVPIELGYVTTDANVLLTPELVRRMHMLPSGYRTEIRTRVFATRDAAVEAAKSLGYETK